VTGGASDGGTCGDAGCCPDNEEATVTARASASGAEIFMGPPLHS
jgi:hypothetical protein